MVFTLSIVNPLIKFYFSELQAHKTIRFNEKSTMSRKYIFIFFFLCQQNVSRSAVIGLANHRNRIGVESNCYKIERESVGGVAKREVTKSCPSPPTGRVICV